jgi:hypothetical protein
VAIGTNAFVAAQTGRGWIVNNDFEPRQFREANRRPDLYDIAGTATQAIYFGE